MTSIFPRIGSGGGSGSVATDTSLGGVRSGGDVYVDSLTGKMYIFHKDIAPDQRHGIYWKVCANASARLALVPTIADIGKVVWQQDDDSLWMVGDSLQWIPFAKISTVPSIIFDENTAAIPRADRQLLWDNENKALALQFDDTTLQIGQELYAYVYNGSGSTIPDGKVVASSGVYLGCPSISLALASSLSLSDTIIGITTQSIPTGEFGFITLFGKVNGLNISFPPNSPLFISHTVPGAMVTTPPPSPNYVVRLGHSLVNSPLAGSIFVSITPVTQLANAVRVPSGPGVTQLNNLQDFYDITWSAGIVANCDLTNNGNGTVSISSGEAVFSTLPFDNAPLMPLVVPAQANIQCLVEDVSYIYVSYNAGNPVWQVGSNINDFNNMTTVLAYVVGRNGNTLNIIDVRRTNVDIGRKARQQKAESDGVIFNGFYRSSRAKSVLSSTGLSLKVSDGRYFYYDNPFIHTAFDTSIAGTAVPNVFTRFYGRTGNWLQTAGLKTVNNTQYDLNGVLTTLGNNKYRTDYIYVVLGSTNPYLISIMGNVEYSTVVGAQGAPLPSSLPPQVDGICVLVGQVVILKNDTVLTVQVVGAPFSQVSSGGGSGVTDHNLLTNLQGGTSAQYYHLTSTQYGGLTAGTDSTQHFHASDRSRANHTGTQPTSTIEGLNTTLAAKADLVSGTIPTNQLPTTDGINEGSVNKFFTESRTLNTSLAGFSPSTGTITASTPVITAFNYLQGNFNTLNSTALTASGPATLTNKTINLNANTLLGTTADFNAALQGADFAYLNVQNVFTNANNFKGTLFINSSQDTAIENYVDSGSLRHGLESMINTLIPNIAIYRGFTSTTSWDIFWGKRSDALHPKLVPNGLSLYSTGEVLIHGGPLGYAASSGEIITQFTSRSSPITINKSTGRIVLASEAASTAWKSFTVFNSKVTETDVVYIAQRSGTDKYQIWVTAVGNGTFEITFAAISGSTVEQPTFNFAVLKGALA